MRLAGRLDRDLDVLSQRRQEFNQTANGKIPRAIAHQSRDVRLLDPENSPSVGLRQSATLDNLVNLKRQASLEHFLLRIGQTKVRKDVAGIRMSADRRFLH